MREYSKVSPRFWTGDTGREIRALGDDTIIVATYLVTAPGSNMIGLYYLPIPTLAHETGRSLQGASRALARLSEAQFALYDDARETVWVVEMARHQIGRRISPKDKQYAGLLNQLSEHSKCPLALEFWNRYAGDYELPEACKPRPSEAPPKGLARPTASGAGAGAGDRAGAGAGTIVPDAARRNPPSDMVDLFAALSAASGGRFVAGDPSDWSKEHLIAIRSRKLTGSKVAALGAWWAAGHDEIRGDTISLEALAGGGIGPSVTKAVEWERKGRPAALRFGRQPLAPTPAAPRSAYAAADAAGHGVEIDPFAGETR